MNRLYNRIIETLGNRTVTCLSEVQVKSAIAWPPDNAKLPAGHHSIRGFAWTGAAALRGVEFSSDGGHGWVAAKLETPSQPLRWVRWSVSWNAPAGDHILMSRATDSVGKTQPLQRDSARKDGYELNSCAPVHCFVR